jgi:hypothetical protein
LSTASGRTRLARRATPNSTLSSPSGECASGRSRRRAEPARLGAEPPVHVEAVRVGVDLDRGAVLGGRGEHRVHVDRVRVALEEQAPGGVAEHGEERVGHGAADARGHLASPRLKRECTEPIT